MNNYNDQKVPLQVLSRGFVLGFSFLAWMNGLGILVVLASSASVIPIELEAQWPRLPLGAFLGGLALVTLGLLWTYPVQSSLITQLVTGRVRKTHWIPLACVLIAYTLSLLAFAMGCWMLQGMFSVSY